MTSTPNVLKDPTGWSHVPPRLGGRDGAGFDQLRNKERTETQISFLVSDFTEQRRRVDPPRDHGAFPRGSSSAPLEERVVVIEVQLEPDIFLPGKVFRGAVAVRGYDNLELSLTVWSDE